MRLPQRRSHRRSLVLLIVPPLIVMGCQRHDAAGVADPPPASNPNTAVSAADLPFAGTEIPLLPPGAGRGLAQTNCLACHAPDMILQQRLTETQWRAEVDKMQRWGAEIRDEDKADLVLYLVAHFGPDNERFTPIVARPETRVSDSAQSPARPQER
jgi:hypothetical protein